MNVIYFLHPQCTGLCHHNHRMTVNISSVVLPLCRAFHPRDPPHHFSQASLLVPIVTFGQGGGGVGYIHLSVCPKPRWKNPYGSQRIHLTASFSWWARKSQRGDLTKVINQVKVNMVEFFCSQNTSIMYKCYGELCFQYDPLRYNNYELDKIQNTTKVNKSWQILERSWKLEEGMAWMIPHFWSSGLRVVQLKFKFKTKS